MSDLDRVAQQLQLVSGGYVNAIQAMADYPVVVDPEQAAELKDHLLKMRAQLERASQPEDYGAVQSNLRGELRLYRDQTAALLEQLRRDARGAETVLQSLSAAVIANGVDYEKRLEADIKALAGVQALEDLGQIRQVVRGAVEGINESWRQLNRANQLVIAQLHDEIRALHRQMDRDRHAQITDNVSGAWNRERLNQRIDDNLGRGDTFCLVLAAITNFANISASVSPIVMERTLQALVKRIHGVAGADAMVGRWSESEFGVLLEAEAAHGLWMSGKISRALSSRYSIQEDGVARTVILIVDTSLIDHHRSSDPQKFRDKLAGFSKPALPA